VIVAGAAAGRRAAEEAHVVPNRTAWRNMPQVGRGASVGRAAVPIRPEAERKLRAGFQRRVDQQSERYAAPLAHAGELAARFGYGEVVGVFSARAGGGVRPSLWRLREPRRCVWFYAFDEGFMLLDDPRADAAPVRWSQVTEVGEVWTEAYDPAAEQSRLVLTAYRLRLAGRQAHEISRSFRNVRDPYGDVGQLLRGLAPASSGQAMPTFPTIDEIIAAYARTPAPGA